MNGCLQLSVSPSAFHFNSKFNGLFLDNLGLTCSHIKTTVIDRVTDWCSCLYWIALGWILFTYKNGDC